MIPLLPHSWSELTWQQLCQCWVVKICYGRNPAVARAAALLELLKPHSRLNRNGEGTKGWRVEKAGTDTSTGEQRYVVPPLHGGGSGRVLTPRELSYYARKALPWFDFPYGDQGEKEQHDDKGNIIKESREAVPGYVGPMRDALALPIDYIAVKGPRVQDFNGGSRFSVLNSLFSKGSMHFALPQVACNNLTWQQYRSLQVLVPQLFSDNNSDEQAIELQARFLANILSPRSFALFDTTGGNIKFRPHYVYQYNAERAGELEKWFWRKLRDEGLKARSSKTNPTLYAHHTSIATLFNICFQAYQTAVQYYRNTYPLLFSEDGQKDTVRDALEGEVGTINTIMKYAGYNEQQQVYDSNLPFVLDILNTMAKEAKEIEKMKIKKK